MTLSPSSSSPDYEGVEVRVLPPGAGESRQRIGGSSSRYWSHGPQRGSHLLLEFWQRITGPDIVKELKRLGFRAIAEGLVWRGPKSRKSVKFCETLKSAGLVLSMEDL